MRTLISLTALPVCLLVCCAALTAAAPELAVEHVSLSAQSAACVGYAATALQAAGFQNTNLHQTVVTGSNNFLSASVTCLASGNGATAVIAVSGAAETGAASRQMAAQLRNSLRDTAGGRAVRQPVTQELPSTILPNTNLPGRDMRSIRMQGTDPTECAKTCLDNPKCKAWAWVRPGRQAKQANCWIKSEVPRSVASEYCVSGVMTDR
jgi:hypothetical protein